MDEQAEQGSETEIVSTEQSNRSIWSEDVLAVLIGIAILLTSLASVRFESRLPSADERAAAGESIEPTFDEASGQPMLPPTPEPVVTTKHNLADWVAKPGKWTSNPAKAFGDGFAKLPGLAGVGILVAVLFTLALLIAGRDPWRFLSAFPVLFLLGLLAYLLAGQALVKAYNLEYALWALALGLVISNTVGVTSWLRGAVRTEFYIKTGLVLLGSEILLSRLLALGLPGVFVAWVVTPIVLVTTFWFGQRVLKIKSPTLNMVISADMSVCGVSAAIASAAACRAKKEELSFAIGLSLSFTVIMMVLMPAFIKATGMDLILGAAWMGGTIDATGAVAAAGELLDSDAALEVAATIKMIQNILIGVIAFGIAVFWTTYMDRDKSKPQTSIGWSEIWIRFPKFILGFVAASILFSVIYSTGADGQLLTKASIDWTKPIRGWLFCLAFVSIGLETNFSEIRKNLAGGKPLLLYLCGQTLNLTLTLAMAYLMFKVVFPEAAAVVPN